MTGIKRQSQQEQETNDRFTKKASMVSSATEYDQVETEMDFNSYVVDEDNVAAHDEDENDWNAVAELLIDVGSNEEVTNTVGQHTTATDNNENGTTRTTEVNFDDDEEQLKQLDALVLNDSSLWLSLPPPLPLSMTGGFDDGSDLYYGENATASYGLVGEGIMIPPAMDHLIHNHNSSGGALHPIQHPQQEDPLSMSMACSIVSTSSSDHYSTFSVSSSTTSSRSNSPIFDQTLNEMGDTIDIPTSMMITSSLSSASSSSSLSLDASDSAAIAIAAAAAAAVATGEDSSLVLQQQGEEQQQELQEALSAVVVTTPAGGEHVNKGNDGSTKKKKKRKTKASSSSSSASDESTGEDGSSSSSSNKRSRRYSYLKPETVQYLRSWMMSPAHVGHPYPTDLEKRKIMADTGLELKQLMNWFVNNRKRYWKPRVDKKKKQEEEEEAELQQQLQLAQDTD